MRIFREVFGSQGEVAETAISSNEADKTGESSNGAESKVSDKIVESPHSAESNGAGETVELARGTELLLDKGSKVVDEQQATAQCARNEILGGSVPSSVLQSVQRVNENGAPVNKQPATAKLQKSGALKDGKPYTPFFGPMVNFKPPASNCDGNVSSAEKPKKCSSAKENKGKPTKLPYVHLRLLNTDLKTTDCATNNIAREPLRVIPLAQQVERTTRKIKPVVRLNYGIVECCSCKKKIRVFESIFERDDGNILCSIECFKKS